MHLARAFLRDSSIGVCAFNPCIFINFRTLWVPWRLTIPFLSTGSALFSLQWRGRERGSVGLAPERRRRKLLLDTLLSHCFQQLPSLSSLLLCFLASPGE